MSLPKAPFGRVHLLLVYSISSLPHILHLVSSIFISHPLPSFCFLLLHLVFFVSISFPLFVLFASSTRTHMSCLLCRPFLYISSLHVLSLSFSLATLPPSHPLRLFINSTCVHNHVSSVRLIVLHLHLSSSPLFVNSSLYLTPSTFHFPFFHFLLSSLLCLPLLRPLCPSCFTLFLLSDLHSLSWVLLV